MSLTDLPTPPTTTDTAERDLFAKVVGEAIAGALEPVVEALRARLPVSETSTRLTTWSMLLPAVPVRLVGFDRDRVRVTLANRGAADIQVSAENLEQRDAAVTLPAGERITMETRAPVWASGEGERIDVMEEYA